MDDDDDDDHRDENDDPGWKNTIIKSVYIYLSSGKKKRKNENCSS